MDKEQQLRGACRNGRLNDAKRLVDEGVDVESTDEDGWTPLIYAAANGKVDIIQFLLDRGANIDVKDVDDDTVLHWAACNGNIDMKDDVGWTALYYAASEGHDAAARLLIEGGANLHMKDNSGNTPLDIAKEENESSTAAIIEAMQSIKVIYTSSQDLQQNKVTLDGFNNNIILISDNNIPDGLKFEEQHPVITLRHLQQCIDQLPPAADNENDIPPDNLHSILTQRHPAITQRLQHWGMNLLHLILYYPQVLSNDMHEAILSLLAKYPQATTSIDIDGMTPLHHAVINLPKKKISQECHDLLLARSTPIVVHKAIEAGMDWEYLHPIVMAKLDALTMEDEMSGLVPFMIAAEKCNDDNEDCVMLGSLSMAYELLCLQPDVLKEYDEFNMRKRLRDESSTRNTSSDQDAKRVRGT